MLETGKVLQFPARTGATLSAPEALRCATDYLSVPNPEGRNARRAELTTTPDVLLSVCALLRERVENSAGDVFPEASGLYKYILDTVKPVGVFDERDYFLGELALLSGMACRVLGRRAEADVWFERAEAGFRHTVNPSPLLAAVSYQRLALRCEAGQYSEVSELAPLLARSFAKLNMPREYAKCMFLEGLALKQNGDHERAVSRFDAVTCPESAGLDPGLAGLAYVHLADIYVADGRNDLAEAAYAGALPLLARGNRRPAIAQLKGVMGETLRRQGRLTEAAEAYGAAVTEYEGLGMAAAVAYLRIVLAQTLLEDGKPRQAEWQILAALPTVERESMAPEGYAAVALLRESVRQRNANPQALSELREYLRSQN